MKFLTAVVLISMSCACAMTEEVVNRQGKVFSLFSVVNFKNDQCTASSSSSLKGTCMTAEECSSAGGSSDGNCASGFGVCCLFTVSTCGSDVSRNCTYIQNPSYPSTYSSTSTTCSYTFSRFASDICQLRLDFDTLQVATPPSTTGLCTTVDSIAITQPTSGTIPTICGTLTGQHMYLETGSSGTMGTIAFTIGSTTTTRQWNIKVTAIECTAAWKAPEDCLQYYTGVANSFSSFNYAGGNLLQSQQYKICFRAEEGYCKIAYRQNSASSPDPFLLENDTSNSEITCPGSNVSFQLPGSATVTICGTNFCNTDESPVACTVTTDQIPFEFNVYVDNTAAASLTGFYLDYTQIPCAASE